MRDGIALRTKNERDQIALRGVRLCARLTAMGQRTTVEQTFVNLKNQAIEAVYTFPLPENAAVCGFEVVTGDRVLTGQVEEREKAIETYEESISRGDAAYLLEQERPDIFSIRVGNIKPRQAATIRLTYVSELSVADRTIRVALPTTVSPRYVTATGSDPLAMIMDGEAINPPNMHDVPYGLTLDVTVDLGRALKAVSSPSHTVRTEFAAENVYRVTLADGMTSMNRDVVINLDLLRDAQPMVQLGGGPDGASYVAVTFLPEFGDAGVAPRRPADVAFLIDCSGSMAGESIHQARTALELCLRSMSVGDSFVICRFGSTYECLTDEPLVYSEASLAKALAYVSRMDANLGGTEVYEPLEQLLELPTRRGAAREVVLLTDGQVSNEAAIIKLAGRHRGRCRIFSFGIGASPSAHLVHGLASASGGAAEFIAGNESIADKVLRTFGRLSSPVVTDVGVDWHGVEATLASSHVPPLFEGDNLTVYARLPGALPEQITLRASIAGERKAWRIPMGQMLRSDGAVSTLWARKRIEELESSASEAATTLVTLSKTFNLICSQTAYLALEHRTLAERNEGRPSLRRVPVALAKGWGGSLDLCEAPAVFRGGRAKFSRNLMRPPATACQSAPRISVSFCDIMRDVGTTGPNKRVFQLLTLQSAEGWFDWNRECDEMLEENAAAEQIRRDVAAMLRQWFGTSSQKDRPRLQHTLLALTLLRTGFAAEESVWRRAKAKAVRYLATVAKCKTDNVVALLSGIGTVQLPSS